MRLIYHEVFPRNGRLAIEAHGVKASFLKISP
jgi:hypothetical protein